MDGKIARCGTPEGYEKHRREGTDICEPCRKAKTRYNKEWFLKKEQGLPTSDLIPMIGTYRRIQALMTLGWPLSYILDQSNVARRSMYHFRKSAEIHKSQADRIARTYRKLMLREATSKEVRQQAITMTKQKAAGWAGPMDWNNIDKDPFPIISRPRKKDVA